MKTTKLFFSCKKYSYSFVKKAISLIIVLNSGNTFAQGTATAGEPVKTKVPELFLNWNFYLLVFLFFIMSLTILVLFRSFKKLLRAMAPEKIKEETEASWLEIPAKEKKSGFWQRFDRNVLTKAVPVEREEDVLLHHNYDGIRELDNKLPPWWVWGFYITIIWAVFYMLIYHVSGAGKLSAAEYADEMNKAKLEREEMMKRNAEFVTAENVVLLSDVSSIGEGKDIFIKNCAACHRPDGGGQVGPNLTDDFWLHGGGIKNVFNTITEGVPAKGMISWKSQFAPNHIQKVASFILTLHGTNPPNPKEPQGDKWTEEVALSAADTVAMAKADSTMNK